MNKKPCISSWKQNLVMNIQIQLKIVKNYTQWPRFKDPGISVKSSWTSEKYLEILGGVTFAKIPNLVSTSMQVTFSRQNFGQNS